MINRDVVESPEGKPYERIPPGQHQVDELPTVDDVKPPRVDVSRWTFTISGAVEKKRILNFEQFMALPMQEVLADAHCVTGWSKLDNLWEGVGTAVIRRLVRILPGARFVMAHAEGGFSTNLGLDDFFAPGVLLAVKLDGEPLSRERGFPVRLVVPHLYFYKSIKWIDRIDFMEEDRKGYWESRGYHSHGDPWKEERYGD